MIKSMMRFRKYSSILFYSLSFFVLWSIRLTLCVFRLKDLEIKEYYLGSSRILGPNNNSRAKKRDIGQKEFIFPLQFADNIGPLNVLIRTRKSDIVLENTQIYHIKNGKKVNESSSKYYLGDSNLYEGYILDYPYNTSINGYIKENCFYGHVIINNTCYFVDEINRLGNDLNLGSAEDDQPIRNAVFYNERNVKFSDISDFVPVTNVLTDIVTQHDYRFMFQRWKGKGMLCPLVIVIDYSFLTLGHNGNKEAATTHVLFSLEEVNALFRSTDFDGDGIPDNVGFYVKKIVVLSDKTELYYTTQYTEKLLDVNDFIHKFKSYEELRHHCLGIIFTAQKFTLKTLGASFSADHETFMAMGGICDMLMQGRSYNALVITVETEKYHPVPQMIFDITIAHELGHSFGSSHDDEKDSQCFGHLMAAKTFSDYERNVSRMLFSNCSKKTIARTLAVKGYCFEQVKESFCGNGIVEDDEQCDCGLTRECLEKDPCCVPRKTQERPCRVNKKRGFECHPSQGTCCTDRCKYSTDLNNYVNCKHFENICPCSDYQTKCRCGINGMCVQNECHSIECTRFGLKECLCQEEKPRKHCSVCCNYKDRCLPAIQITDKIISEEENDYIPNELFTNSENSKFQEKNWVSKNFCLRSQACVNLHFFQGKRDDYCLLTGKLGRCDQNYNCKIWPPRQVFPSVRSVNGVSVEKISLLNVVFYYVCIYFLNIMLN